MTEIEELKNRLFEKDASLVVKFSNGEIKDYFNKTNKQGFVFVDEMQKFFQDKR